MSCLNVATERLHMQAAFFGGFGAPESCWLNGIIPELILIFVSWLNWDYWQLDNCYSVIPKWRSDSRRVRVRTARKATSGSWCSLNASAVRIGLKLGNFRERHFRDRNRELGTGTSTENIYTPWSLTNWYQTLPFLLGVFPFPRPFILGIQPLVFGSVHLRSLTVSPLKMDGLED